MVDIKELSYVVAGGKDLAAWEKFATQVLGLEVYSRDEQRLYLRADINAYRVCIERNDSEDVIALGWAVSSEADLDAFAAHLKTHGVAAQVGTPEDLVKRRVLKLLRFQDPNGIVNEVVWGAEIKEQRPFRSPIHMDGFLSGPFNALGHVVVSADNVHASRVFYRDVLFHKVTTIARLGDFEVDFLRCNRRHHSIAFAESHRPKRLQHIQLEYQTFDDIGRAMDRAADTQTEIVSPLGRHIGDRVTSFYVRAPSGLVMELAYGARIMDEDAPTEFESFSGSIWGHRYGMENT